MSCHRCEALLEQIDELREKEPSRHEQAKQVVRDNWVGRLVEFAIEMASYSLTRVYQEKQETMISLFAHQVRNARDLVDDEEFERWNEERIERIRTRLRT